MRMYPNIEMSDASKLRRWNGRTGKFCDVDDSLVRQYLGKGQDITNKIDIHILLEDGKSCGRNLDVWNNLKSGESLKLRKI